MNKVRGASRVGAVRKRLSAAVALIVTLVSVGITPAVAVDQRYIDVVQVGWNGAQSLPADAQAIAQIIDRDVNARWLSYTTLVGDLKDRAISFKAGQVLPQSINLTTPMPCLGVASNTFMNQIRAESYKRLGIDNYKERYLLVVSPNAGCVWSGRAQMGEADSKSGTLILHDSSSAFVIAHELGHTFGLGHSSFLRCDSGIRDGAWGSDCKAVEYGGTIDAMGNVDTPSPLNTYHLWRMGYLDDSQIKQSWLSETIQLAPSDFADGTRAIFIRDGKAVYWVEYRRAIPGVTYNAGLVVYRLDPPPASSVVSPNPEDLGGIEFSQGIGEDLWMLNLDNYKYVLSKASGSMTGNSATTYSGNVSISSVASGTGAAVTITRKADVTPPPTPVLTNPDLWRFPGNEILKAGYEDVDSVLSGFEVSINGVVQSIQGTATENWSPTYLNPFSAPQTLRLRDLPEGDYTLAVRSIDIAGNKSQWSQYVKVTIDRGDPVVTNDFSLVSVDSNYISLSWNGTKDPGTGLCQTNIVDEDGLILHSSSEKANPVIKVEAGKSITAKAQIFDCIGNGVTGDLSVTNTFAPADKSSRTGKWIAAGPSYGAGAVKCVGKCTASLSSKENLDLLVGAGSATVTIAGKTVATIADSKVNKMRVGASISIGKSSKVLRLTGSNFVFVGALSYTASFTNPTELDRLPAATDPTLADSQQVALSKLGFNAGDFDQSWTVLPMNRGTTLLDPTLDLCSGSYASEKNRVERRQIAVTKQNSPFSFLSSEVVRYNSAASAMAAHGELLKVLAQCKSEGGYKDATGNLVPYAFKTIKSVPSGLVPETSRVLVHIVMGTGTAAQELLGFYQFSGNTFTGLYVMKADNKAYTEAQVNKWLKVASTMAQRMQGKAS